MAYREIYKVTFPPLEYKAVRNASITNPPPAFTVTIGLHKDKVIEGDVTHPVQFITPTFSAVISLVRTGKILKKQLLIRTVP